MRPASIKETKNGYNDENYITPRTLKAALADYSPGGGGSSEGGTTDYNKLENKPSINGVTLSQNKTLKDLGIQPEGPYLTEVPDTYKTKDENDKLYQPKGSYQPAGTYLTEIPEEYLTESEANKAYQPKGDYQETLVSGENIKTVNGQTLLGEGDLTITGGGGGGLIDTLPVGTMIPYGSAETPANWLSCNGQAVSRTTYSHLFKVIGTSYGAGDGSTTFNLPDKRGRISVGYDPDQELFNKVGAKVGANTHTLTIDEMPSHKHNVQAGTGANGEIVAAAPNEGVTSGWNYFYVKYDGIAEHGYKINTAYVGGGKAHSILQASEVDHWIIKAYPLSSPEDVLDPLPVGTIVEYDGEEIPDGFEEIDTLSTKQRWEFSDEFQYNTITNGTWSLLSPFVSTPVLPKGRYLALYKVSMHNGGGEGVCTINAGFNNERIGTQHRASMPLSSSLVSSAEVSYYFELEEAKSVTLSAYAYAYGSNGCSLNTFNVHVIKLDSEDIGLLIDNAQEYSNDEKIIGTWNGKPLYRKKFEYMGLAMNVENVIGTIDNADEVYIEESHLITTNDAKLSYPLNMVGYAGNTTDKVYAYAQAGKIKVYTNGGWGSSWKVVVVAKYTKTTD